MNADTVMKQVHPKSFSKTHSGAMNTVFSIFVCLLSSCSSIFYAFINMIACDYCGLFINMANEYLKSGKRAKQSQWCSPFYMKKQENTFEDCTEKHHLLFPLNPLLLAGIFLHSMIFFSELVKALNDHDSTLK